MERLSTAAPCAQQEHVGRKPEVEEGKQDGKLQVGQGTTDEGKREASKAAKSGPTGPNINIV